MRANKILIIGAGGILGKSTASCIGKLKEDFGDEIVIVEEGKIIYPDNVSVDDIVHLGDENIPIDKLLGMVQDLKTKNDIDSAIKQFSRPRIEIQSPEVCIFNEGSQSSFIPSRGGDKQNRGNKKLIRK